MIYKKNHKQKKPAGKPEKRARSQTHGKAKKLRRAIAIRFLKERSQAGREGYVKVLRKRKINENKNNEEIL